MPSSGKSTSSEALSQSSIRYGACSNMADDCPRKWYPPRVAKVGALESEATPSTGSNTSRAMSTYTSRSTGFPAPYPSSTINGKSLAASKRRAT